MFKNSTWCPDIYPSRLQVYEDLQGMPWKARCLGPRVSPFRYARYTVTIWRINGVYTGRCSMDPDGLYVILTGRWIATCVPMSLHPSFPRTSALRLSHASALRFPPLVSDFLYCCHPYFLPRHASTCRSTDQLTSSWIESKQYPTWGPP